MNDRHQVATSSMREKVAINLITKLAIGKGLSVVRNSFSPGWSIKLSSGGIYLAKTMSDLINYVKGY